MGRPCTACGSPHRRTIDAKIKSGVSYADIGRWLAEMGVKLGRDAIARHAMGHVGMAPRQPGLRAVSTDFLEAVRDTAHEELREGRVVPTLADGIKAQTALDQRAARGKDHDLMLRIGMALTGRIPGPPPQRDPRVEAIEGEFQVLLEGGSAREAEAVGAAIRAKYADQED